MSHKSSVIFLLERELFSCLNQTINKIATEAYKLNGYRHFEWHFFRSGSEYEIVYPLNTNAREFLSIHKDEYHQRIKDKEEIIAYLIKFLNETKHLGEIYHLVPASISTALPASWKCVPETSLISVYRNKPEYKLMMAQATLNSMGV